MNNDGGKSANQYCDKTGCVEGMENSANLCRIEKDREAVLQAVDWSIRQLSAALECAVQAMAELQAVRSVLSRNQSFE
jgi:hypothetical protein